MLLLLLMLMLSNVVVMIKFDKRQSKRAARAMVPWKLKRYKGDIYVIALLQLHTNIHRKIRNTSLLVLGTIFLHSTCEKFGNKSSHGQISRVRNNDKFVFLNLWNSGSNHHSKWTAVFGFFEHSFELRYVNTGSTNYCIVPGTGPISYLHSYSCTAKVLSGPELYGITAISQFVHRHFGILSWTRREYIPVVYYVVALYLLQYVPGTILPMQYNVMYRESRTDMYPIMLVVQGILHAIYIYWIYGCSCKTTVVVSHWFNGRKGIGNLTILLQVGFKRVH